MDKKQKYWNEYIGGKSEFTQFASQELVWNV